MISFQATGEAVSVFVFDVKNSSESQVIHTSFLDLAKEQTRLFMGKYKTAYCMNQKIPIGTYTPL